MGQPRANNAQRTLLHVRAPGRGTGRAKGRSSEKFANKIYTKNVCRADFQECLSISIKLTMERVDKRVDKLSKDRYFPFLFFEAFFEIGRPTRLILDWTSDVFTLLSDLRSDVSDV